MLLELSITDFAIIDTLHIGFGPDFNALTGETGAGKSIVIDALGAVLGARAGAELVRSGRAQARVEAVFDISRGMAEPMPTILEEQGIEPEAGTLILSRDIYSSGRTTARVNGRTVTTSVLQQIGQGLVDIHGQSDHLSLLRPARHIDFLDDFAGLTRSREAIGRLVGELRAVRAQVAALERDDRELAQRVDLLTFQVEEIEAAAIAPDEEAALEAERHRLVNAERLTQLADTIYRALQGSEGRGGRGALDALREATTAAESLASLDPARQAGSEALAECFYLTEEIAREARAYRDAVEHDPARLEQIGDRLQLLRDLKRKYGATLAEVIAHGAAAATELATLTHRDADVAALREREAQVVADLGQRAALLSQARQAAAGRLAAAIEESMQTLNMGRARFSVAITQQPDAQGVPVSLVQPVPDDAPAEAVMEQVYAVRQATEGRPRTATAERSALPATPAADDEATPTRSPVTWVAVDAKGIDRVEFLISTNPGEPLKPLARIASGGETARLMLALKSILAAADATPTLVFDEVDVGIGGRSGMVVGERLWELTAEGAHQVICITHLPQIAAFAETHFTITKLQRETYTTTAVTVLDEQARIEELAAMLGGLPITEPARANAAALLERVRASR